MPWPRGNVVMELNVMMMVALTLSLQDMCVSVLVDILETSVVSILYSVIVTKNFIFHECISKLIL